MDTCILRDELVVDASWRDVRENVEVVGRRMARVISTNIIREERSAFSYISDIGCQLG